MINYRSVVLDSGSADYNQVGSFLRCECDAHSDDLHEQALSDPGRLTWCSCGIVAEHEQKIVGVALLADPGGILHDTQPTIDVVYVNDDYRNKSHLRVGSHLLEAAIRFAAERFPTRRIHCVAANPVMLRLFQRLPDELRELLDTEDAFN